jgi:hypothetical protein
MTRSGLIKDLSHKVCIKFKKEFVQFADSAEASQDFMNHLDSPCNVCGDALDIVLNFDAVQMRKLAKIINDGNHTPATRDAAWVIKMALWVFGISTAIVAFILLATIK